MHDEFVLEVPNDVLLAHEISDLFCEEIRLVGEQLGLRCPLKGDGHIGLNWRDIH